MNLNNLSNVIDVELQFVDACNNKLVLYDVITYIKADSHHILLIVDKTGTASVKAISLDKTFGIKEDKNNKNNNNTVTVNLSYPGRILKITEMFKNDWSKYQKLIDEYNLLKHVKPVKQQSFILLKVNDVNSILSKTDDITGFRIDNYCKTNYIKITPENIKYAVELTRFDFETTGSKATLKHEYNNCFNQYKDENYHILTKTGFVQFTETFIDNVKPIATSYCKRWISPNTDKSSDIRLNNYYYLNNVLSGTRYPSNFIYLSKDSYINTINAWRIPYYRMPAHTRKIFDNTLNFLTKENN